MSQCIMSAPKNFIDNIKLVVNRAKITFEFPDERVKIIGFLYLIVWLLHVVLDPGISYVAVELLGKGWETNPLMRVPMQHGLLTFSLIQVPLYLGILIAYVATVYLMKREFERGKSTVYHLAIVGLSIFIIWGLWLNVRNILVLIEVST